MSWYWRIPQVAAIGFGVGLVAVLCVVRWDEVIRTWREVR